MDGGVVTRPEIIATLTADGFTFARERDSYFGCRKVRTEVYKRRGSGTPAATGKMLREDTRRRGDNVEDSMTVRYSDHGYVVVEVRVITPSTPDTTAHG